MASTVESGSGGLLTDLEDDGLVDVTDRDGDAVATLRT